MLAVASTKRWPLTPDVPTLGEVGYPSLDFDLWFGFMGPKGLSAAIVQKWNDELAQIGAMADVKDGLFKQGLASTFINSADTGALIRKESARWSEVIKKAGIKPE